MITFIKKDVTTALGATIVQGCNAQGVMGSGVARAIRDKWPGVFADYANLCDMFRRDQTVLLGMSVVYTDPLSNTKIVNGITQVFYGKDGQKYANPEAIRAVLLTATGIALEQTYEDDGLASVHLPRIGCGLGGLSWDNDVHPVLLEVDEYIQRKCQRPVHFFVCDPI